MSDEAAFLRATMNAAGYATATEEDKFFAQLLTPNLIELEEYWKGHGLEYRDFVTILMDRAKTPRGTIEKALGVLYNLQKRVLTAKRVGDA